MTPSTGRHPTWRASGRSGEAAERVCATGRSEAKDAGGEHKLRAAEWPEGPLLCDPEAQGAPTRLGGPATRRARRFLNDLGYSMCGGPRAGAGPKGRALHRSLPDVSHGDCQG